MNISQIYCIYISYTFNLKNQFKTEIFIKKNSINNKIILFLYSCCFSKRKMSNNKFWSRSFLRIVCLKQQSIRHFILKKKVNKCSTKTAFCLKILKILLGNIYLLLKSKLILDL